MNRPPLESLAIGTAGLVAIAAAIAMAIGVAQYTGFLLDAEAHRKVLERPSPFLPEVLAHERAELAGYRWVDRKAGVVALPIERAIELTLAERRAP